MRPLQASATQVSGCGFQPRRKDAENVLFRTAVGWSEAAGATTKIQRLKPNIFLRSGGMAGSHALIPAEAKAGITKVF
jgi:hypothetical protein